MSKKTNKYLIILIVFITCLFSVGYSALNKELNISGELTYRPDDKVRIINFLPNPEGSANNMTIQYADYSKREVKIGCTPSDLTATVTYDVTVENKTNYIYVISEIEKVGSGNITYELVDYKIGQPIGKGEKLTFKVKFNYNVEALPEERGEAVTLKFTFVKPYAEILKYDNTNSKSKCTNVQCALDDLYDKLR